MNISICNVCNNNCSYCFQSLYNNKGDKKFITLEHYQELLNFINFFNNDNYIRIIGGEPTLHPQIIDILELTKQNGYIPLLITNLSCNLNLLKQIINLKDIVLFINATQPEDKRENFENNIQFLIDNNISNFGLSFCVTTNDEENSKTLKYLEHLLKKFKKLNFRISPASPNNLDKHKIIDYSNIYLKINDLLNKYNSKCVFDCPQTPCTIPINTLQILRNSNAFKEDLNLRPCLYEKCHGALDILLDDKLYFCNSLNSIGIDIKDYSNLNDCYNALIFKISELMNEENTYKFCDKNCQFLYDCQGFCPAIVNNFLQFNKE